MPDRWEVGGIPTFPPALEDLALIVDEATAAREVEAVIRQTGGALVSDVRLFDVYRGEQIGKGKKSLAYSVTYQAGDHTLTTGEVAQARGRIVKRLEAVLGARLRS